MTRRLQHSTAFTLIELMISIALVVILMVGITKVFSLTSQTAGATNQLSSILRDSRSAQQQLYQDFSTAVARNSPCMLLFSERKSAFRNKADEQADRDGNPMTVDLDGDNQEGMSTGETYLPANYNNRSHRTDSFSVFTRQRLGRQTGGSKASVTAGTETPMLADMTSDESWIWFGHLVLPDNNGNFLYQPANTQPIVPGSGTSATNPNNYYATQWILAREAILLRLIDQPPSTADIRDRANTAQAFIDRPAIPVAPVTTGLLQPLEYGSQSNVPVANRYKLEESRFDLAGTSIDEYRDRLETWIQRSAPVSPMPGSDPNWWYDLFCATDRRFHANPFVARPLTAARFAQQAPIFLQGCTQFIVEYAGDFVAQEPATLANGAANPKYGQVTNVYTNTPNGTDGQIDFLVLWDDTNNNGLIDPAEQPSVRRQIRWYGLPRDTNNDNSIPVNCAPGAPANAMPDVVPLRDVWRTATTPGPVTGAPFERFNWIGTAKVSAPTKTPTLKDYAPTGSGSGDYLSTIPTSAMAPDDTYTCAWGPSDPKPKMIRIIITLDDPSSKLADGKTFEFVFTLP